MSDGKTNVVHVDFRAKRTLKRAPKLVTYTQEEEEEASDLYLALERARERLVRRNLEKESKP